VFQIWCSIGSIEEIRSNEVEEGNWGRDSDQIWTATLAHYTPPRAQTCPSSSFGVFLFSQKHFNLVLRKVDAFLVGIGNALLVESGLFENLPNDDS